MLANLVAQVLLPDTRPKKRREQKERACPLCHKAVRARNVATGKLKAYCTECAKLKTEEYRYVR